MLQIINSSLQLINWFLYTENVFEMAQLIMIFSGVMFAVITLRNNNKINQTNLLHDFAKEEIKRKRRLLDLLRSYDKKSKKNQDLFENEMTQHLNYYEHFAYFVNSGKVGEKDAINLWRSSILKLYNDMHEFIIRAKGENKVYYKEFEELCRRWRDLDAESDS